ncbi:FMN-dependent NADH-azoreductase [Pseudoduganella sp. DS3]|uniref:FMN dependent NADH:quinone oxidoreductase n=1 Tax=Pseudoduganella guangdongensis TaxID=2692179 RepID=A0A6N9HMY7_9BURK|nr:NAD(P)H-dependent oxidoreductase [Pseudoduganella guangdongensis]MYN04637.1 FMN-dependent NADH-azoreductase [Pseudoduganella guangdongensis]
MNILQINSSAKSSGSESSRVASNIVNKLLAANPGATVAVRDLAANPHPVLDESALQALFTPADQRSPEQAARVALDDALIAQVQAADVIVLGAPMYNFGITVQLKSWFDAIARAGVTFKYTENGPLGLLQGKKVYVATSRGGMHKDAATDTQFPHLKLFLAFIGLTDVEYVFIEGQGYGPEVAAQQKAAADARVEELLA